MCVLVLLRVYICASTNYSEIIMVKGTERAVSGFLRTKGGAGALAVAPRLPT